MLELMEDKKLKQILQHTGIFDVGLKSKYQPDEKFITGQDFKLTPDQLLQKRKQNFIGNQNMSQSKFKYQNQQVELEKYLKDLDVTNMANYNQSSKSIKTYVQPRISILMKDNIKQTQEFSESSSEQSSNDIVLDRKNKLQSFKLNVSNLFEGMDKQLEILVQQIK